MEMCILGRKKNIGKKVQKQAKARRASKTETFYRTIYWAINKCEDSKKSPFLFELKKSSIS